MYSVGCLFPVVKIDHSLSHREDKPPTKRGAFPLGGMKLASYPLRSQLHGP
jgi:hypothetical protein